MSVSTKFWRFGKYCAFLAGLSDNAEAIVGEVFKAVGAALGEFHFAMEALC